MQGQQGRSHSGGLDFSFGRPSAGLSATPSVTLMPRPRTYAPQNTENVQEMHDKAGAGSVDNEFGQAGSVDARVGVYVDLGADEHDQSEIDHDGQQHQGWSDQDEAAGSGSSDSFSESYA